MPCRSYKSRRREQLHRKMAAMRAAKQRNRVQRIEPPLPVVEQAALRRIVLVVDFATGRPIARMLQLWRTGHRKQFRVASPRGQSSKAHGWSQALAVIRKALPA